MLTSLPVAGIIGVAANSLLGNNTGSAAAASSLTIAQTRTLLGLGSAALLDVGTSANQVVQLTAAGKLPAVDGSLLTNLPAGSIAPLNIASANVVEQRNSTNAQTLSIANTHTSDTNFEYGRFQWSTNEFRIGTAVGSAGGTSRLLAVGYWNTAGTWKSLFTWDANDFVKFPVAITKHGTNTSTAEAYIGNTQVSQISDGAGYSIASNGYTAPGSTSPITGFTTRTGYGQVSRTASVFSAFHGTTDAGSYWEWRRAAASSTSTTRIACLDFGGNYTLSQQAATSGSPTAFTLTGAAHTTLTASTEASDVNINLARTVQFATGALTTQRAVRIQAPTYAFVSASTITTAVTLDIGGAPVAGTNATISTRLGARIGGGALIGTATSDLIGFWNSTPIVQPTTAVASATRVMGIGVGVLVDDTYDGYTVAQVVKALRNMGLLA